jgi:hypothetical protein
MSLMKRIAILPAAVATCGIAAGCFSYHKNVETTPAPVVETAPAPVVTVPAETSSTTTTTTDNGLVQRQKTTTYTAP